MRNLVEIRFLLDEERAIGIRVILENGFSGRSGRKKENLVVRKKAVEKLDQSNIRYEVVEEF